MIAPLRILFIGESWLGSCARSLREALSRLPEVVVEEVDEDLWMPRPRLIFLRALARLTAPLNRCELYAKVISSVNEFRPDVVVVYKGFPLSDVLIASIQKQGVPVVNVYPDCSPHAHGDAHRHAVGRYDLVISTKEYHPGQWNVTYGYANKCVFVPQGYDPSLHLFNSPPAKFDYDVVLVGTWRQEYGLLMRDFASSCRDPSIRVAIGGYGWERERGALPPHWVYVGPIRGRTYVEFLRKGKICLAPLTREVVINGQRQPGDVDTTRTYELAAAHCFFVHHRTYYVRGLYDEQNEVPMFETGSEMAHLVDHYLSKDDVRHLMAGAAHARAVPFYSLDERAREIVAHLRQLVGGQYSLEQA